MASPRQFDIKQGEENPHAYKNLPELNPSEQIEGVPDHEIIQLKANHAPEGMEMAIRVEEKQPAHNDPEADLAIIRENAPERKESICRQFMPLIAGVTLGGFDALFDACRTEDSHYTEFAPLGMLATYWLLMAINACMEPKERKTMLKTAFTTLLGTASAYAYSTMKDAPSNSYIPLIINTAAGITVTGLGSMCSFFSRRPRREVAPAQVALLAAPGPRN